MKSFTLLLILITLASCDKNPISNSEESSEPQEPDKERVRFEYTATLRVQTEDGTPCTNARLCQYSYPEQINYHADSNGEMLILEYRSYFENDSIPEVSGTCGTVYKGDDPAIAIGWICIPIHKGLDYPLFIVEFPNTE